MTRGTVGHVQRRSRRRKRNDAPKDYANLKKLWDTRWTPNTPLLRDLIMYAVYEAGNRRKLSEAIGIKTRVLRRILKGDSKAVCFRLVDQILARSDMAYMLRELPWLTVDELLEQGIWNPQWGNPRKNTEE